MTIEEIREYREREKKSRERLSTYHDQQYRLAYAAALEQMRLTQNSYNLERSKRVPEVQNIGHCGCFGGIISGINLFGGKQ